MDKNNQSLDNDPREDAVEVTGHDYQNDFEAAGWQSGGVMQSDTMLGPQDDDRELRGSPPPAPASSGQYGDDRDSTTGDKADSSGRHDNPYDSAHPVTTSASGENETPNDLAGLSGHSGQDQPAETNEALPSANRKGEGQSHLYTAGTTEEDFPAT